MKTITIIAGIIGSIFLVAVLRGWVLTFLWGWFVVPFGVPQIGIAWSIGLAGLVGMMMPNNMARPGEKVERSEALAKFVEVYALLVTMPLTALLCGWITHLFMVPA